MDKATGSSSERRRGVRLEIFSVTAPKFGDQEEAVAIFDVSQQGLQFETQARIEVGDMLKLVSNGRVITQALVVWKRASICGCRFDPPVRSSDIPALLDHSLKITIVPPIEA